MDQPVHPGEKAVAADDGDHDHRRQDHSHEEETPQLPALTLICDVVFFHLLSQQILIDVLATADVTNLAIKADWVNNCHRLSECGKRPR